MIVIDTDVLAVYYIYKWDERYPIARNVLKEDLGYDKATTIINVLELSGIMALAQSGDKARKLFRELHDRLRVLYWKYWPRQPLWIAKLLKLLQRRLSLGDALIAWIIEEYADEVIYFVTWNTKHFRGKIPVDVVEPEKLLKN